MATADWASVDWRALSGAAGVSAASATIASAIMAIGGIPLGYWLARRPGHAASTVGFLVQLPLALPPLTSGILLLFLIGPYSTIGRMVGGSLTDSFTGILLAGIFVASPFLIVAARSAFSAVDPILEDVAATLGHHAYARFFKVALPLAWPAIRAGLLLSWLRAFGEFGATVMVAYHPYSLPVYTYVAFGSQGLPAMIPIIVPTLSIALLVAVLTAASTRLTPWASRRSSAQRSAPTSAAPAPADSDSAPASTSIRSRTVPAGNAAECTMGANTSTDRPTLSFAFRKTLADFTLDIAWTPTAKRLAILGESGSGKSMTLRLLAGLDDVDANADGDGNGDGDGDGDGNGNGNGNGNRNRNGDGKDDGDVRTVMKKSRRSDRHSTPRRASHFVVHGRDYLPLPAEARHIAYVPQDFGLFPHKTVFEQWAFARDANLAAARYWSAHLGLLPLEGRFPSMLSIGQRQRVAIVRALARPCSLILLDEPFSALDTPRRKQLRTSLRRLQREIDATTILVTHDPDEAALLSDEMLVLAHGRLLQQGATQDVFARPANAQVAELLGLTNVGTGTLHETDGKWSILMQDGDAVALHAAVVDAAIPVALGANQANVARAGTAVMWRIHPDAIALSPSPSPPSLSPSPSPSPPSLSAPSGLESAVAATVAQHFAPPPPDTSSTAANGGVNAESASADSGRPAAYAATADDRTLVDGRPTLVIRFAGTLLSVSENFAHSIDDTVYFTIDPHGIDVWPQTVTAPRAN